MDLTKISKKIDEKRQKYKEQGHADKEFEKKVRGKEIKMWLPSSVFDQQKLLSLGAEVITSSADFETNLALTKKFYIEVCKHALIDAKEVNPELMEFAELQAYSMLYYMELLAPLSLWGDILAEEILA